jgi:hypothetical protein
MNTMIWSNSARQDGAVGWKSKRYRCISILEKNTLGRQCINIGCYFVLEAVATKGIRPGSIHTDQENIAYFFGWVRLRAKI